MFDSLQQAIVQRDARIAVMGLGYVGLPLLVAFYRAGFQVLGYDPSPGKIAALQAGHNYIQDVDDALIPEMLAQGRALFSADDAVLAQADVILICVPTPLHKSKEPDLSYIQSAGHSIQKHLRHGQLIILESTTFPGTTDEVLLPLLEQGGLQQGKDFELVFSPERIDPGNRQYPVEKIPKVVGGLSGQGGQLAALLYRQILEQVHLVQSARVAETAKILENTFRSVNIALVNEFSGICRALGVDVWEVIEAAATKPFGFMKFLPGPGIGGHCIPLDPHYLMWKSRLHGFEPRFMALADQINTAMPAQVVQLVMEALNQQQKALNGAHILVLGVAYKPEVADSRESPAQYILPLLQAKGAQVSYHDPFVPSFEIEQGSLESVALSKEQLRVYDLALVVTAHQGVDYAQVAQVVPLIVDTRNVMRQVPAGRAEVFYL